MLAPARLKEVKIFSRLGESNHQWLSQAAADIRMEYLEMI
jgi:hypothetical protein